MTPQEMIDVIQAYKDGKQIEFKSREPNSKNWETTNCPSWSFTTTMYRIKQKEKTTKDYYKYLIKNKNSYYESSNFFTSLEEAKEFYKVCEALVIKRIDNSKIIIEEE